MVVKKLWDLSKEELKQKEWFTYKPCFFHKKYHPMLVKYEESGRVKLVCIESRAKSGEEYIVLDGRKISEVISETTSLVKDSVVKQEIHKYVKNLRVFSLEDLEETLKSLFTNVLDQINVAPIEVTLKSLEVKKYEVKVSFEVKEDEFIESYSITYPLEWGSRGAYLTPSYYTTHKLPYRSIYLTSREFEKKVGYMFRIDVFHFVDSFHCNLDTVKFKMKVRNYVESLSQKLGLELTPTILNYRYRTRINGKVVTIDIDFTKEKEPYISSIEIVSHERENLEEVLKQIVNLL